MTGAEILAQVREELSSMVMPPEMMTTEAERSIAASLEATNAALDGCVLLTAEEAAVLYGSMRGCGEHSRDLLVLLTPEATDPDEQLMEMEC